MLPSFRLLSWHISYTFGRPMRRRSFGDGADVVRSRSAIVRPGLETSNAKEPLATREPVFVDPGLSRSRKVPPKAIWSG